MRMEGVVLLIMKISTGLSAMLSVGAIATITACAPVSTAPPATVTFTQTVHDSGPTFSTPSAPAVATPRGPAAVMATDGTYRVGVDIQPGTYKSAPTHANSYPFCTWTRLSDFSGSTDSEIAIDNSPGQTIVTIAPTDVACKTLSCQPWEKVG
jgi:hypothetical protein